MGSEAKQYMTAQEIADKARVVVAAHGSQTAVAKELGLSQAAVSKAVAGKPGYEQVCLRILELGGYKVKTHSYFEVVGPVAKKRKAKA